MNAHLIQRQKIFDLWFASSSKKEIREHILSLSDLPQASSVIFANAHVVVESHWNRQFQNTLQSSTFIVPDGVPIAWVLKNLPQAPPVIERYSGPDLMVDIFKNYSHKKHFFLGSTPETLEKIKNRFKSEFGTEPAGLYSPPFSSFFSEEEKAKQLELVNASGADFIWVGLGAPKQEKHVVEMSKLKNSRGVWLAVGAAFDFYAGQKPRAPETMQKMGMEWAFRLATDPKRLASRYLKTNPVFIQLALKEILKYKTGL